MLLDRILAILLNLLLKRAERLARKAFNKVQTAEKRGEVDEANIAKYKAAEDRAAKIKASLALLNGTKSP